MRLAVHTAVCGRFDVPKVPAVTPAGVDWVCHSDEPERMAGLAPPPWRVVPLERGDCPAMAAKAPKLDPGRYLPDYDATLWVDAYFQVLCDPLELALRYLEAASLAARPHKEFRCAYDLLDANRVRRRCGPREAQVLSARMKAAGVPLKLPCLAGNILLRKACTATDQFYARWRAWVYEWGTPRDEPSLAVAWWQTPGLAVAMLPQVMKPRRGLYLTDDHFAWRDRTPW